MQWNRSPDEQQQINQQEDRATARQSEINAAKDYYARHEGAGRIRDAQRHDRDGHDSYDDPSGETIIGSVVWAVIIGLVIWIYVF